MNPFSLLIKPASADCNLRCDYCFYLDHAELYPEDKVHRMSEDVLSKMIGSYMKTEQKEYVFAWQGGEPTLMGLPFFQRVVELQKTYGKKNAVVGNGFQTNGVLIDEDWAKFLSEYKFLVGISLDGPEEIHNTYRLNQAGKGSYGDVMRTIDLFKKYKVEYNILCLVSQANVHKAKEIFEYYQNENMTYLQFIPCVEFDEAGNPLPYSITGKEWGAFLCEVFDAWYPMGPLVKSIRLFDSILMVLMMGGRKDDCHMRAPCVSTPVIEYNGDVYPCDFFVEPKRNMGSIMTDSWDALLNHPEFTGLGAQKSEWNEACTRCPYKKFCMGDCLKHRMYAGHDSRTISWLCEGWKQFYEYSLPRFKKTGRRFKHYLQDLQRALEEQEYNQGR